MKTVNLEVEFNAAECCVCHTVFFVTARLYRNLIESGKEFFCPGGHAQHFTPSDNEKLSKQLSATAQHAKELNIKLMEERENVAKLRRQLNRCKSRKGGRAQGR